VARFPASQLPNLDREVIHFVAIEACKQIECAISIDALEDHFGSARRKHVDAFLSHRAAINGIAQRLIDRGRFEADGTVLIRTADCRSI
jgi:hypothetical protein